MDDVFVSRLHMKPVASIDMPCAATATRIVSVSLWLSYTSVVSPLCHAPSTHAGIRYIYSLQHPTRCAAQSFWMLYFALVGFARAQTHTRNTHSSQLTQVHLVVITAETGPKALRVFNVMNFCFHYYNILLRFVVWLLSFSHLWLGY